jgi:hypothetical protein
MCEALRSRIVSLVVCGVFLLDGALLFRRHHRDTGVQRAVNLAVLVGADAICEAGEAAGKLGPEGDALANRHVGVDRPERGDMFAADLSVDTTGLHQARLKAAALMSEADKHRSVIKTPRTLKQRFSCHYAQLSRVRHFQFSSTEVALEAAGVIASAGSRKNLL